MMNINYTWRNTLKSDSIEELTTKKLNKLERHFDHVKQIHVILETVNKLEHTAKASTHLAGIDISAHASAEDMYKAIDAMVHKLIRQIESHKAKLAEHRDHKHNDYEEEL